MYKILIEDLWEPDKYDYNKIDNLVKEIYRFSSDMINVQLILFLSGLQVLKELNHEKIKVMKRIFELWKSFDYLSFFSCLKKLNAYDKYLNNPDMIKLFLKKLEKDFYLKDK